VITAANELASWLPVLRAPGSRSELMLSGQNLATQDGTTFSVTPSGIPLFAEQPDSEDARIQQQHYENVADDYIANLQYPHTQAYMEYLDEVLDRVVREPLGVVAEICCGRGEAIALYGQRMARGIGVDISYSMLEAAKKEHAGSPVFFAQGDATSLPMADESVDTVFMLGGIHHVGNRSKLFSEISRILKPGGCFYFREPVSDFPLWLWLRWLVYRISPNLDHTTERPLRYKETEPPLRAAGLALDEWRTHGFLGFCFFMNSDVLIFNRLFRFIPGIRAITRMSARLDEAMLKLPGFSRWGLQVVGVARKT
jgi:ubiquinone/menaquinone biosynthesis C-methylase UbiE